MKSKLFQTLVFSLLATVPVCRSGFVADGTVDPGHPVFSPVISSPTAAPAGPESPSPDTQPASGKPAIDSFELSAEDAEQVAGLEDRLAGLRDQGKFAESVGPAREVFEIRQRIQGDDYWATADARRRMETFELAAALPVDQQAELGQAFAASDSVSELYTRHHYEEALALAKDQQAVFCRLLGETHQETLIAMSNMAGMAHSLGRWFEAEGIHRQVLEIRRSTLGNEHPSTVMSVGNLGSALNSQGKMAEAEPYVREALDYFRRTRGDDDPSTLSSINNMGYLLEDLGRLSDAEAHYREALDGRRRVLGDEHSQTLTSANNLGLLLMNSGRLAEAEPLLRESLEGRRRSLGDEHRRTLTAINNLGLLFIKQGRMAEAEPLCRRALEARRRLLGDDHQWTLNSINNLGLLLSKQGRTAESEPLYREAMEGYRRVQGDVHADTLLAGSNLAVVMSELGRMDEAERLFRHVVEGRRRTLGEDHFETLLSMSHLGFLLLGQDRFEESGPLLKRTLDGCRRELGDLHPITLNAIKNMSRQYRRQNRLSESGKLLREALSGRRRLQGESHPTVTYLLSRLAELQEMQGDIKGALATWTEAALSFESSRLQMSFEGLERTHFAAKNSPLPSLAACLVRSGKPLSAWQRFEESMGRGLLDTLSARHSRPLSGEERNRESDLLYRLERLDEQISALPIDHTELDRLTDRADDLRRERESLQSELARFEASMAANYGVAAGELLSLSRIQSDLPADTALLGWLDTAESENADRGGGEHWACVVRGTGEPAWVRLPGSGADGSWTTGEADLAGELRDKLGRWRSGPAARWRTRDLIRQLHAQRLAPLADHLKGIKRLVVLPAGSMHGVPLEVLTDEYTISYAPSGTLYSWLREKTGPPTRVGNGPGRLSLLALGDPLFSTPDTADKHRPDPPEHGVLVIAVSRNSNAMRSGLEAGDVLLRYDGRRLAGPDDLTQAIQRVPASSELEGRDRISLTVWREGKTVEIRVAPGKLGVKAAKEPAPQALISRRRLDQALELTRGGTFRALPHTRLEVETISRLFRLDPSLAKPVVLLGSEASEQRLDELAGSGDLEKFRFIHLATHGEMDDRVAMRSALILSQDHLPDSFEQVMSGEEVFDGRLTGDQILRTWKLNAELVTLSGCRTALGKESGGEGYLGFAQALFAAGARSLLLSLWQVEDRATMLLMNRFYENILGRFENKRQLPGRELPPGRPMPKAEALREAKRWLRNLTTGELAVYESALLADSASGYGEATIEVGETASRSRPFEDPRYWAAFILLGE